MAVVANELGVSWWTVMDAVVTHGTPLVDDPERVGWVRALGIDETSFLSATRDHHTVYATGMVDLDEPKVIDMVEGNSAADLRRWFEAQDQVWLEAIELVATDLDESYRKGMAGHLDHAVRVADPFHVVRAANRVVDKVRRRVQNETLGHYAGDLVKSPIPASVSRPGCRCVRGARRRSSAVRVVPCARRRRAGVAGSA